MSEGLPPPPLSYASAMTTAREAPDRLLRAGRICGRVPGAVGLLILLGYFLTRSDLFQALGFVWLLLGGLIVLKRCNLHRRLFVYRVLGDDRPRKVDPARSKRILHSRDECPACDGVHHCGHVDVSADDPYRQ